MLVHKIDQVKCKVSIFLSFSFLGKRCNYFCLGDVAIVQSNTNLLFFHLQRSFLQQNSISATGFGPLSRKVTISVRISSVMVKLICFQQLRLLHILPKTVLTILKMTHISTIILSPFNRKGRFLLLRELIRSSKKLWSLVVPVVGDDGYFL